MEMSAIEVAKVSDIPAGTMKSIKVEGKQLLLSNVEGKFYAINGTCTHAGGDLSKGKLESTIVTCPRHGSRFDVTTGVCLSGPKLGIFKPKIKNEEIYEVRVENNIVTIKIN
jgi:3-phenylpropionate/trans-cinnamate dioxygenase ferredoxin component